MKILIKSVQIGPETTVADGLLGNGHLKEYNRKTVLLIAHLCLHIVVVS